MNSTALSCSWDSATASDLYCLVPPNLPRSDSRTQLTFPTGRTGSTGPLDTATDLSVRQSYCFTWVLSVFQGYSVMSAWKVQFLPVGPEGRDSGGSTVRAEGTVVNSSAASPAERVSPRPEECQAGQAWRSRAQKGRWSQRGLWMTFRRFLSQQNTLSHSAVFSKGRLVSEFLRGWFDSSNRQHHPKFIPLDCLPQA